ncbi:hypothetical protein M5K25_022092 [Dendrobium thyrsiflorum]|uniref:Uncharacterized protein n=1 Tax=Dendrobium thyrsiflorum TaxID=117978 RepID=A0ABD0U5I2_DENTH
MVFSGLWLETVDRGSRVGRQRDLELELWAVSSSVDGEDASRRRQVAAKAQDRAVMPASQRRRGRRLKVGLVGACWQAKQVNREEQSPTISGQLDDFEENFKELKKWVDVKSSKYCMLVVVWERRNQRLGTALKLITSPTSSSIPKLSSLEAFVYPVPASVLVSEQSCPLLRLLSIPCLHQYFNGTIWRQHHQVRGLRS